MGNVLRNYTFLFFLFFYFLNYDVPVSPDKTRATLVVLTDKLLPSHGCDRVKLHHDLNKGHQHERQVANQQTYIPPSVTIIAS